ncbi:FecR family protein [Butyricimonas synergistica]|uniref:FecR family protein n=1 Tax=Butyricimonas synergistica TaxID=544644 RepID=UPI000686775D|nr:FecR family protein [Butyricimonas synergistica]
MRDNRIGFRIAKLLARQRAGQITDEEVRELEAWKGKLPENEELFLRWQKGDFFSGEYAKYKEIDVSRAKDIMQKRIDRERRAGWRLRVLRISVAAAVVLLAVGSFYFFKGEGDGKRDTVPSIALISAQRPTLKLNDGSVVLLDSVAAGFEEEGVTVSRRGGSTLAYLAGDTLGSGTLAYNTLNVPKGAEFNLVLADGTQVWLNAESKLKYPVVFGSEERVVELEGEGFFKVSKDASRPFRVKTKSQVVEVLGTEFNVDAYPDEGYVYTTLVEGKVKVDAEGKSLELVPGMQSVVGGQEMYSRKVNTGDVVSWKNGMFVLEDKSLEEIMSKLARWYDFNIFYQNQAVKEITFKGKIPRYASFESILDILERTGEVKFKVSGQTVTVYQ